MMFIIEGTKINPNKIKYKILMFSYESSTSA